MKRRFGATRGWYNFLLSSSGIIQIVALETELENVRERAQQFEEDLAEESQGVDVQLMDSQVAEYNQLKAKARKKTTTLTEQLRLVRSQCICAF